MQTNAALLEKYWKRNEKSEAGHLAFTDPQHGGVKFGEVIPVLESLENLKGKCPVHYLIKHVTCTVV